MKKVYKLVIFIMFLIFAQSLFSQKLTGEKPKECNNHIEDKGNYNILSISNGKELQFYLEIKPKYRTEENYIKIAREFKGKYCLADQLRVIYLKSKKQWLILDPFNLESTPLAIFYTDKNIKEEGLVVYKIVDGNVETRELSIELLK
jgi:hypothetical protein